TNMADWMVKCGALVQPLINLLEDKLFDEPFIHMDETTVQVLKEPGKKPSSKSYMWVRRAKNIILFDYSPSRSTKAAEKIIKGYAETLITDGYGVYDTLANNQLGCW